MDTLIQLNFLAQPRKGFSKVNAERAHNLSQLIAGIPVLHLQGTLEREISSIVYDSRKAGQHSLFVAIPGLRHDGSRFIAEAVDRGATAFITETPVEQLGGSALGDATAIRVENCRRALALVSAEYYQHPSRQLNLIGITGTNGKTTVSFLLESIFQAQGDPTGVIGSINYRYGKNKFKAPITTPESTDLNRMMGEMAAEKIRHCILEVSSHALTLQRVRGLDFAVAVFTNLSRDHLDFHGNMENYRLAKKSLFTDFPMATRVLNTDDPLGREILEEAPASTLTTGIRDTADVMAENIALTEQGSRFILKTPWGNSSVQSPLLGEHNVYNILSAAAAALQQGVSVDAITQGIRNLKFIPGRLESVDLGQDFTVAVDYAHTDDALENVLKAAKGFTRGNIILVFGCGGDRDRGKRKEMGRVALEGSGFAVITSDNPRSEDPRRIIDDIREGIPPEARQGERYALVPNRQEAIHFAIHKARSGDMVLIAGKGHEDYQILKTKTIRFDDREAAAEALKKRLNLG